MAKGQPKGSTGNPNGRPKGTPNKATTQAREAIAQFVEGNVDRLTGWLDRIADDDPKDAFNAFMSVVEYHIPKLQRTDTNLSGEVNHKFTIKGLIDELRREGLSGVKEPTEESGVEA